MSPEAFAEVAREEFAQVPLRFAKRIRNVALLLEEEPSPETRREEGLGPSETLLGLYQGVPATERGDLYSGVLPDTITLYRLPLISEGEALLAEGRAASRAEAIRLAVRETLWHEIGHYFGLSEGAVDAREARGTNHFGYAHESARVGQAEGMMKGALRSPHASRGDRVISLTPPMAKTLAIIFGLVFVLVGILGFVGNPLVGTGALFEADTAHNLVHLILGLVLLAVAFWAAAQSALWLKIVGALYLIIAVLGFLLTPSMGTLLGLVEVNAADNWLHLVLGIVLVAAGYFTKGDSMGGMPAAPVPPPPAPPPAPGQAMS